MLVFCNYSVDDERDFIAIFPAVRLRIISKIIFVGFFWQNSMRHTNIWRIFLWLTTVSNGWPMFTSWPLDSLWSSDLVLICIYKLYIPYLSRHCNVYCTFNKTY
jgi:hypothetical protein